MARPKEIKGYPKQVNLNLESQLYDEFEKLLPRNKSVSEAIREYMKEIVDESKKVEAPNRLPILNSRPQRQTILSEYDIKLFQSSEERFQIIQNLTKEQHTKLMIDVIHLHNQIKAVRK